MPGAIDANRIVTFARKHVGEAYVFGARAPMSNAEWKGPWDCAEFASWCVYQATGVLYGVKPTDDPIRADAYTGYWGSQARRDRATVSPDLAAGIPGACVLRLPSNSRRGHIVFSTGDGGTVEAHSSRRGVIEHALSGRRWDVGVLVPGVSYSRAIELPTGEPPLTPLLRLTYPMMRDARIQALQKTLVERGYSPGRIDGIYGPQTASAVIAFQRDRGIVTDGEVGKETLRELEVSEA